MKFRNSTIKFEKTYSGIIATATQKDYKSGMLDLFMDQAEYKLSHIQSNIETKQIYFIMTKIK